MATRAGPPSAAQGAVGAEPCGEPGGSPLPHTSAPFLARSLRAEASGGGGSIPARWLAERPQALGERESAKEPGRAEPSAEGAQGEGGAAGFPGAF